MKKTVWFILCMAAMLMLAACGSSGEQATEETSKEGTASEDKAEAEQNKEGAENGNTVAKEGGGKVVVAFPSDPGNLSPFGTNSNTVDFIIYQIYDSLYKIDDTTGKIIPLLIESYETSEDGKVYTFHLKEGIKDTNGNEITASDALFSFHLCSESAMAINTMMVNFDETNAVDDYTFQLAVNTSGQSCMAQFAKIYIVDEDSYNASTDGMITTPVGTGPYKLDSWSQGTSVKLVYNENYWGNEPDVKELEFLISGEPSQRTTALMTGEADFIYDYLVSDADYINGTEGYMTEDRETNTVYAVYFNNYEGAQTSDINLRKAICLALDNAALTNVIYGSHNTPAVACESVSCYDYSEEWENCEYYGYDLEKAKEYLEASSYDGSTLTIVTKNANNLNDLSEAIQNSLAQIGITVEIVEVETSMHGTYMQERPDEWELAVSDHMTPSNYGFDSINVIHTRRNYVHVGEELQAQIGEACTAALEARDPEEIKKYSAQAVALNQDNCTIYGVTYATMKLAYSERISNIHCYGCNIIDFHEVKLK